jgi:hypothetical protein
MPFTVTDDPVVVYTAISDAAFVPFGTVTDILVPEITPLLPARLNAVIVFAPLAATVTVTVYDALDPSAAVTVYVTGFVKSFAVTPFTCVMPFTVTDDPVVVYTAISDAAFVPFGTVTDILVPEITPLLPARLNAVIAFASLAATVTVTVYVAVDPSAAVTVYVTGFVKSFAVTPLVCTIPFTVTDVPVVVNVAVRFVTSVPFGNVTPILLPDITAAFVPNPNTVIAFASLVATVTVTVYVAVDPSAAVTVYVTGFVKSFEVTPLVCAIPFTVTDDPVVVNVAARFVTSVPLGSVTLILLPDITASVLFIENLVIDFDDDNATVTTTVYVDDDPSRAVTVYATGEEKSFAVIPLR